MMIIRVVVSIVSFLALGWTQFTETQNSTERRYRERQEMGRNHWAEKYVVNSRKYLAR